MAKDKVNFKFEVLKKVKDQIKEHEDFLSEKIGGDDLRHEQYGMKHALEWVKGLLEKGEPGLVQNGG